MKLNHPPPALQHPALFFWDKKFILDIKSWRSLWGKKACVLKN